MENVKLYYYWLGRELKDNKELLYNIKLDGKYKSLEEVFLRYYLLLPNENRDKNILIDHYKYLIPEIYKIFKPKYNINHVYNILDINNICCSEIKREINYFKEKYFNFFKKNPRFTLLQLLELTQGTFEGNIFELYYNELINYEILRKI